MLRNVRPINSRIVPIDIAAFGFLVIAHTMAATIPAPTNNGPPNPTATTNRDVIGRLRG
jgi:hypothetical protein